MNLDDLSARCAEHTKCACTEVKVLLAFQQKNESTQMIDAGRDRSIKCVMGRGLDYCLMEERSIEKWESQMNDIKRRDSTSHLVANSNEEYL